MIQFGPPSSEKQLRFLASFLFGGNEEPGISDVVRRAYLDLSRTVHGINLADPDGSLRAGAGRLVDQLVQDVLTNGPCAQVDFDAWHRSACGRISAHFREGGYSAFRVGQAQKWINMAVKYSLTLAEVGWLDANNVRQLRVVAHAPLDSYFLGELALAEVPHHPPRISAEWSRISDYDEYFSVQTWLRTEFAAAPLDVEFHLWQTASRRRRGARGSA